MPHNFGKRQLSFSRGRTEHHTLDPPCRDDCLHGHVLVSAHSDCHGVQTPFWFKARAHMSRHVGMRTARRRLDGGHFLPSLASGPLFSQTPIAASGLALVLFSSLVRLACSPCFTFPFAWRFQVSSCFGVDPPHLSRGQPRETMDAVKHLSARTGAPRMDMKVLVEEVCKTLDGAPNQVCDEHWRRQSRASTEDCHQSMHTPVADTVCGWTPASMGRFQLRWAPPNEAHRKRVRPEAQRPMPSACLSRLVPAKTERALRQRRDGGAPACLPS